LKEKQSNLFYGYIVVIVAFIIIMVMFGVFNAFGIFFNPLSEEFHWSRAITSGAFSLAMAMQGILSVMVGRLTDRYGPRFVMSICGILFGTGLILMYFISNFWHLYLIYGLLLGTGMSGGFVPLTSTVTRWFVRRRGIMIGVVLSGLGVGQLIAPPIVNWLISFYNWRTSYLILGIVSLLVIIIPAQLLKRDPSQVGKLPYGEMGTSGNHSSHQITGLTLTEALKTRQMWLAFIILFCFGFVTITYIVHLPPHTLDLGFSSFDAANVLAVTGALMIIGGIFLGMLSDKIGSRLVFIIGFIILIISLLILPQNQQLWVLYFSAFLFGLAQGGMGVSQPSLIAFLFGLRSHGAILGVSEIGFTAGAVVGPAVAGYIFDTTLTYSIAFWICAALSVIGIASALLITPVKS